LINNKNSFAVGSDASLETIGLFEGVQKPRRDEWTDKSEGQDYITITIIIWWKME